MVFSSSIFLLFFFPAFLLLYFLTPVKYKNYTALAGSVAFYAWGAPTFIFLVFAVLLADYFLGYKIYHTNGRVKKIYLLVSICINVGFLFYFKYSNFFVENINHSLFYFGVKPLQWLNVALPIGISFFVFQEMSYTIDIYRGEHAPLKKFTDYMLFIFLFSHLIAGPIVTYHVLADDLMDRKKKLNNDYRLEGFIRFFTGLARKVLIANTLGEYADSIFNSSIVHLSSADVWLGAIAYTFQLYFDFAGYSDMAIGIGKLLGFDFPENFNFPYISQSITEFWQRWHITLGSWMKRYLYIPLGGNKLSTTRTFLNLWIVFLISGFWHGAAWNFIFWGIWHGSFIVVEKLFLNKILQRIPVFFRIIYTFFIVVLGWVLFRANTFSQAILLFKKMFSFSAICLQMPIDTKFITTLLIAILFSFVAINNVAQKKLIAWYQLPSQKLWLIFKLIIVIIFFLVSVSYITSNQFNPFIYFRF
jgi:alginate O-acetyltransferase complex protein AlgI